MEADKPETAAETAYSVAPLAAALSVDCICRHSVAARCLSLPLCYPFFLVKCVRVRERYPKHG